MKYIILSNPNGGLQNLLLLNIIVENIKKLITIEDEISLILWGTKPEENIYFKKENFKLHFKTGKMLHSKLNSN